MEPVILRLVQGDLTAMPVDAIVFYAREDLELGSGFGTAIQSRGGAAVKEALKKIGRIAMGQAVITTAGGLKAGHIIHAVGPKFQEADTERKLREAMLAVLRLADAEKLKTLAFPAMGTGFYGVPLDLCARVMTETIRGFTGNSLEEIVICVVDRREWTAFEALMR
jgi:O-acetyl-ADP-ribose deacetylase (regulator of RNase III)